MTEKRKKIIITSGGTREYIDSVRVMTNISSGKLGATIAEKFFYQGWDIIYIGTKNSILPMSQSMDGYKLIEVNTAVEAEQAIKENVIDADAIIHAMAVSDFGCRRDKNIKLKSHDINAFLEHLKKIMFINPKILPKIKTWNPDVFLVSFKFEVGKTREELLVIANDSMQNANGDLVVANDKEEMIRSNAHIAHIIDRNGDISSCESKQEIANTLCNIIEEKVGSNE